ncbi:uncharacterized protein LOC122531005 [Frieseomelitta varia]|uniref:uncharacterized protein LOC122531005 n=1 Tax=Frieseomelitta varia TaxID=561572 RepID=UPI001CB6A4CE|nr:uncharacterized protein LOC122531005 [Frieseomelitta varia]
MFPCVIRECQSQSSIHVPQHKNRDTTTEMNYKSSISTSLSATNNWRCHYMDIDERAAHVEHKGHWWSGLRETDSNQIESDMRREGIHRLDPTHYTNLLPYSRAESRMVNRVRILCTHASQMHISIYLT